MRVIDRRILRNPYISIVYCCVSYGPQCASMLPSSSGYDLPPLSPAVNSCRRAQAEHRRSVNLGNHRFHSAPLHTAVVLS